MPLLWAGMGHSQRGPLLCWEAMAQHFCALKEALGGPLAEAQLLVLALSRHHGTRICRPRLQKKHNTFTTQIIFTSASLFTFASHVLPLDKCCMAGPKAQRHFRLYRTSPTAPCRTNCAAKFWRHALQTQQKGYQMLTQATLWNSPGGRSKALNCCTMLCGRPNGSLGNLARPELEEFVGSLE